MADFRTHLSVAVVGGALLGFGGWQAAQLTAAEAASLTAATALGGILPDIDSDQSHAIRLIFTLFAVLAVVGGALSLQGRLSPGAIVVACGGLHVGVRYALSAMFKRFSVHRGIWHSLLASLMCGLITTVISYQWLSQGAWMAWAHGLALTMGTLIHLLLDELYSVDLVGTRIKRSFGTAFKLFDYREPGNAILMLVLAGALVPWLPPWQTLVDLLSQGVVAWR
ncbi:membrane protein [Litchfieldella qijiaojingensis]|uniref:Membrane protein n=1 Tax=Litchfieldella qijiaojingensis TaxID=980347 RepID=A0ABQ2ZDQ6_9GAMM|nr:metal-dependent hydrolase [Halomonas qijiaojingensis]GGY09935.1 membrane protein [Halomonas qijiaojingensis]